MSEINKILIGIQARSTSERFPRKVHELIGGKPMLQWVIDAANRAAVYINKHGHKNHVLAYVAVLVPIGDEIVKNFKGKNIIIEGSEHDVLSRYRDASKRFDCDYVVRITADCPLIPPPLIHNTIKVARMNGYDYVSNVDDRLRTSPDGWDCEVISKDLLDYAFENAKDPKDREHVTTFIRREPPGWAKLGSIVSFLPLSTLKISVDTEEDLERVRSYVDQIKIATDRSEKIYGERCVHRF